MLLKSISTLAISAFVVTAALATADAAERPSNAPASFTEVSCVDPSTCPGAAETVQPGRGGSGFGSGDRGGDRGGNEGGRSSGGSHGGGGHR